MHRVALVTVGMGLLGACGGTRRDVPAATGDPDAFPVAAVRLEQNATDGDVEVVFEAKGGSDGLTRLTITAPDGRTVVAFAAPDSSTLGMRQFRFESPEPTDMQRLLAAYPEGEYRFAGVTATGQRYASSATLQHRLPSPTAVAYPADEAADVPVTGLRISWAPAAEAATYIVTVEQGALGFSLSARLSGSASAFAVPDGVLAPGREYQLALGTVTAEGNASFVETTFVTTGKERE